MVNIVLALTAFGLALLYGLGIAMIPTMMISDVLGPRVYPMLLLVLLVGVGILLLIEGLRDSHKAQAVAAFHSFLRRDGLTFGAGALAILAYFLLFEPLGYLLSTLLFLLGTMLVLYRGKRWIPVAVAFGFCAASYGIFIHAFGTQLPRGLLPF